jgi:hypothetical protein
MLEGQTSCNAHCAKERVINAEISDKLVFSASVRTTDGYIQISHIQCFVLLTFVYYFPEPSGAQMFQIYRTNFKIFGARRVM